LPDFLKRNNFRFVALLHGDGDHQMRQPVFSLAVVIVVVVVATVVGPDVVKLRRILYTF
jgi:hypothetical protein